MTDYISRDALSELVGEPIEVFLGRLDLKLPPTVDAEPVRHGKWLPESADIPTICSVCDEDWDSFVFGDGLWYHGNLPKYCPHCGAKMDG